VTTYRRIVTLWHASGARLAWKAGAPLLRALRPDTVQLHTNNPRQIGAMVRAEMPGVNLIVGAGVDWIGRSVANGTKSAVWARGAFLAIADSAVAVRATAVVWNAEGGWKTPPSSDQRARVRDAVTGGLAAVAAKHGGALEQWHTSFDHPTYHSTYDWADWLGAGSPIVRSLPQVYAAPAGDFMAARGALPRREAASLKSWAKAVRAGWIKADAPEGSPEDMADVDWTPYYQLHHVTAEDTISSAVAHPMAAYWAVPTRLDSAGEAALRALSSLDRLGYWGVDAVQRFQRDNALAPDGVAGPLTRAALRRLSP
jgi:hypothetical protein